MIDKATVDKILDTADIVDVVSDFVSLKRRGSNFVGLCPFHDEKTPSFSVSPSRQYCHCFGCGKGGSPVGFIMEHEQLSYPEALRYLARKYHIEIEERELSDEERSTQSERESMLVLNEFACDFFENQMHNTSDGRDIGMAYFRERGFSVETMKKFHLGYSPENSTAFYRAAIGKGYNQKYLFDTGLCIDDKRGGGFDRFRGRVMFPVFNVAGKVIAFGGRTLKNDPAKYFNSPESIVYVKNKELYGLYQAKRAIVKEDKCFLVEGYTDVISMHQAGIENVVASSGTSLTEGQIRMIHRFTTNVTVLYDGDSAGIHASLRGIDMLLAEGLNVKVLLLPEGEDPDSFARSHSASEFKEFIAANESDFITFKMNILLGEAVGDPIKRSAVIGDVVKSISVIPNEITRSIYIKECSSRLDIAEDILMRDMGKNMARNLDEQHKRKEREQRRHEAQKTTDTQPSDVTTTSSTTVVQDKHVQHVKNIDQQIYNAEKDIARYIAKYGFCYLCQSFYGDEERETTVAEYIHNEMSADSLSFSHPAFAKIYERAIAEVDDFYSLLEAHKQEAEQEKARKFDLVVKDIAKHGYNMSTIEKLESQAKQRIEEEAEAAVVSWRASYLEKRLVNDPDDEVRNTTMQLVQERYQLSKIHTQFATVQTEAERLYPLVPTALHRWKGTLVDRSINEIQEKIQSSTDVDEQMELMRQKLELDKIRQQLAKITGERVVNP